jgi:hypothetical protein
MNLVSCTPTLPYLRSEFHLSVVADIVSHNKAVAFFFFFFWRKWEFALEAMVITCEVWLGKNVVGKVHALTSLIASMLSQGCYGSPWMLTDVQLWCIGPWAMCADWSTRRCLHQLHDGDAHQNNVCAAHTDKIKIMLGAELPLSSSRTELTIFQSLGLRIAVRTSASSRTVSNLSSGFNPIGVRQYGPLRYDPKANRMCSRY